MQPTFYGLGFRPHPPPHRPPQFATSSGHLRERRLSKKSYVMANNQRELPSTDWYTQKKFLVVKPIKDQLKKIPFLGKSQKESFLMAVPIKRGGGGKGLAIKKKNLLFLTCWKSSDCQGPRGCFLLLPLADACNLKFFKVFFIKIKRMLRLAYYAKIFCEIFAAFCRLCKTCLPG